MRPFGSASKTAAKSRRQEIARTETPPLLLKPRRAAKPLENSRKPALKLEWANSLSKPLEVCLVPSLQAFDPLIHIS
jgi:hypothetical protein